MNSIYASLRDKRNSDGIADISAKECAKLIREQLRKHLDGVRFSVRSDYNSIDVSWTDGPVRRVVEAIIKPYGFGGFDGSIDLAYSSSNWLHPDGTMTHAASGGTAGSMGYVKASATDCPTAGAIWVRGGPRYVFAHRTMSDEHLAALVRGASVYYGFDYDPSKPLHNQVNPHMGEYLPALAYKFELITADGETASV